MVRTLAGARTHVSGRWIVTGRGATPSSTPGPDIPTIPDPPDPPPAAVTILTGPTLISKNTTEVVLRITTDQFCQEQVEYGTTVAYGSLWPLEASFTYQTHQETITGLTPGTTYHFRFRVRNAAGQDTYSSDIAVATDGVADPPPVVGTVLGFANYVGGAGPVTGGTSGSVITVNNASQLISALQQTGARIIQFGTGGTYDIGTSTIQAKGAVTIDGSTCPSPGVTIRGGMIQWTGAGNGNVIVNDIRHRGRSEQGSEIEQHVFGGINEASGFLFIRCSFSGALSETIGHWRGSSWVSYVECIWGRASYTGERRGLLFGNQLSYVQAGKPTRGLSLFRCVMYENYWRNPAVGYWDTGEGGPQATITIADIANNVIFAHDLVNASPSKIGGYGTTIYQGATANVRYNWYYTTQPAVHVSQAQAYAVGNYSKNGLSVSGNVGSPFAVPAEAVLPITTDARAAAASVLTTAGCRVGGLDATDQNIISTISAAGL